MTKRGVSSVFRRLFLRFVGIILLVFLVIALLLYQYVAAQREVELSGQVNRVTNAAAAISQQIQAVANLEQELFSDSRLEKLANGAYRDDYERSQLILDIQSGITRTRTMNGIIQEIVVTFPAESVEISTSGGYHKRHFNADMFEESKQHLGSELFVSDGDLIMCISSPLLLTLSENDMPDYDIRITLSGEYLRKFIAPFHNGVLAGAFWAFGDSTEVIQLYSVSETECFSGWSEAWTRNGCPEQLKQKAESASGSYHLVSSTDAKSALSLVAWQDSRELGWQLMPTLIGIALVILFMGLLMGLLVIWANRSISKPIYQIMDAFGKVQDGNLGVRIYHDQNDEFAYIYDSFNRTVQKTGQLLESTKEQAILLQKAEQLQLQSQINPHFLYNSFYNIKFMAQNEDYEQIEAMVTALAKYYRFLNKETEQTVTLETEAGHMESYIAIQQMRFGDKITVELQPVPKELASFRVPKLILQPIVENAYNYGLKNLLSDGMLRISYAVDEEWLRIAVEDNGGMMTPERLDSMNAQMHTCSGDAINHALTNVHRRLVLAFGEDSGAELAIGDGNGLKVTLKMKKTAII